ncbi:MAG: triose-phosphate isomerase [Planctomycetota bacterium]|nr:triose-phosphate isomerase [Planctomycetota bacterium]
MRKPVVVGNWKMNLTLGQAVLLAREIRLRLGTYDSVEVGVCPPFPLITAVQAVLSDTKIGVGAQNMHYERNGAFTGEVSAEMLKSIGVKYVIIGHSERRKYFGETDEGVRKKLGTALDYGFVPILCVGETLEEREAGKENDVVVKQMESALEGFSSTHLHNLIIAYEPVWAIGTGKTATPETAQSMHSIIREFLMKKFGASFGYSIRIQYGGSVRPENISGLMVKEDIDGALVGGDSLNGERFAEIVMRSGTAKGGK